MNAYELHEAAFDSANDETPETVKYVQQYADGAFDLAVSEEVAQTILNCRAAYRAAVEQDGQGGFQHDDKIRRVLEEIEL